MLAKPLKKLIVMGIFVALIIIIGLQTFTDYSFLSSDSDNGGVMPQAAVETVWEDGDPCVGDPIDVDYTWPHPADETDFTNPWECSIQCEDGVQRYIRYVNDDIGTPCENIPGCLDWGEDNAITCIP